VLGERFADGSIWPSIGATSLRMLFGWAFASLLGVVAGAAIGSSAMARDFLEPTLEFLRPLPASAVIPVAILFLGLSNEMSISVIAFGAIWPVLLSSVYGFGSLQVRLREGLGRARAQPHRVPAQDRVPGGAPRHPVRRAREPCDLPHPCGGHGDAGVIARARARHLPRATQLPQRRPLCRS
jgi:ABC-type nitrate/sulfonate/bicarbonate transport system permease component